MLESIASVHDLPDESMDVGHRGHGLLAGLLRGDCRGARQRRGCRWPGTRRRDPMVAESLAGTAELLRHRTPFEIQTAVASPGGSTEAGLEALAAAGGAEAFRQAYCRLDRADAGKLTLEPILALTRGDVAAYVNALFTVYIILIFIRVLMSWIPRLPDNGFIQAVASFVRETTDPYLNMFRRMLPPVGGGGMSLDLSPMVGVILLLIGQQVCRASCGAELRRYRHLIWAGLLAAVVVFDRPAHQGDGHRPTSRGAKGRMSSGRSSSPTPQRRRRVRPGRRRWHLRDPAEPRSPWLPSACSSHPLRRSNGTWIAGGLILGGAAGNLIDRIRLGHVTDFILLPQLAGLQSRRLRDHGRSGDSRLDPDPGGIEERQEGAKPMDSEPHPVESDAFSIVYRDEHLMVIDKGCGPGGSSGALA